MKSQNGKMFPFIQSNGFNPFKILQISYQTQINNGRYLLKIQRIQKNIQTTLEFQKARIDNLKDEIETHINKFSQQILSYLKQPKTKDILKKEKQINLLNQFSNFLQYLIQLFFIQHNAEVISQFKQEFINCFKISLQGLKQNYSQKDVTKYCREIYEFFKENANIQTIRRLSYFIYSQDIQKNINQHLKKVINENIINIFKCYYEENRISTSVGLITAAQKIFENTPQQNIKIWYKLYSYILQFRLKIQKFVQIIIFDYISSEFELQTNSQYYLESYRLLFHNQKFKENSHHKASYKFEKQIDDFAFLAAYTSFDEKKYFSNSILNKFNKVSKQILEQILKKIEILLKFPLNQFIQSYQSYKQFYSKDIQGKKQTTQEQISIKKQNKKHQQQNKNPLKTNSEKTKKETSNNKNIQMSEIKQQTDNQNISQSNTFKKSNQKSQQAQLYKSEKQATLSKFQKESHPLSKSQKNTHLQQSSNQAQASRKSQKEAQKYSKSQKAVQLGKQQQKDQ